MSPVIVPPSFDLLSRPWLPVVDLDGIPAELSLMCLVREAHRYGGIAHEDPLVVIATYRFVLAFLHRALDGPKETRETAAWFKEGFPLDKIEGYARKWEHRFDLFDEKHPFCQHPGLTEEKWVDHWSRLETARGNFNTNFLYNHRKRTKSEYDDSASPQQVALQLLSHQQYFCGGTVKRLIDSAKAAPFHSACLTIAVGRNLRETLCLNLIPYGERHNQEAPHWESDSVELKLVKKKIPAPVRGLTESYTRQAVFVRLLPNENGKISKMLYVEGSNPGKSYDDPMACMVPDSKDKLYPLGYREERGLWRDLHSFVPGEGNCAPKIIEEAAATLERAREFSRPLEFTSFGIVKKLAGKIWMWRQETLRLPPLILKAPDLKVTLETWVRQAQEEAYQLSLALKIVAAGLLSNRRNGASTRDVTAQAASFQADSLFWPRAETLFWQHIDSLPHESEQYYALADEIEETWNKRIADLKVKVFREVTNALEPTPETLRAINKGYRVLWKGSDKE